MLPARPLASSQNFSYAYFAKPRSSSKDLGSCTTLSLKFRPLRRSTNISSLDPARVRPGAVIFSFFKIMKPTFGHLCLFVNFYPVSFYFFSIIIQSPSPSSNYTLETISPLQKRANFACPHGFIKTFDAITTPFELRTILF